MRTIIAIAASLVALSSNASANEEFRPIWGPTVEADNGQQYQLANITPRPGGMAGAFLYTWRAPGEGSLPDRVLFDCRGHMALIDLGTPMSYVPPRSVAGRLAELACADIKGKKPL